MQTRTQHSLITEYLVGDPDAKPYLVGDPDAKPYPTFTYFNGSTNLTVVRVDNYVYGDCIVCECRMLDSDYGELTMDDELQYKV